MARRKGPSWAEKRRQAAEGLERETFVEFIAGVKEKRQELDDCCAAHAGAWKKADPLGIHPEAAKLYCRLDKMEDTKRTDFLRAFDRYREWADWSIQPDLFEETSPREEIAGSVREEDEAPRSRIEPAAAPPVEAAEAALTEEADPIEETAPAEATEELTGAGYTFAAGKEAARQRCGADDNPHPPSSPSHPILARGHAQGLRDREAEAADSSVQPLNGARSSRRAAGASAP